MSDRAQADNPELEAIQRQLADTRQHIGELEALISELPEIYERKFEQQLQPLLEQERHLLQQNLLLRDQLQRALPATAARLLLPAAPTQASPAPRATKVPARPPVEPVQPLEPSAASQPPQGSAGSARTGEAKEQRQPHYRLALLILMATVAGLGAFALAQRQLAPGPRQGGPSAAGATLASPQASRQEPPQEPAAANPTPGSAAPTTGSPHPLELLVITHGPSWIELRDLQGQTLHAALLDGRKRFRLGAGLSLKAGRPELVEVQLGTAPAQALPPGEWWTWHRFEPAGA